MGSSAGYPACKCRPRTVVVTVRKANYSAFSGYHYTPSDYSEVACTTCGSSWRTKAKYVDRAPDYDETQHCIPDCQ